MEYLLSDIPVSRANDVEESVDIYYEWFKEKFYRLTQIQLNYYKEKQMKRRINTLIERKGLDDYESFIFLLENDEKELASFVDYITINVTEFFRTPAHWEYLRAEVLPRVSIKEGQKLRIWCSASSSGEEPYSVAMCLADYIPLSQVEIIATDIDVTILSKAVRGEYDERSIGGLPEEYLEKYFERCKTGWRINDEIRSCIDFRQLDLLKDEYPVECDMIICRNVLIYFTEEAKENIYKRFRQSLKNGGYLFTGDTEQIVYFKLYGFKKEKNFLYRTAERTQSILQYTDLTHQRVILGGPVNENK